MGSTISPNVKRPVFFRLLSSKNLTPQAIAVAVAANVSG